MNSRNISAFKVIGMVGMLAEELSTIAADGKVTVNEILSLGRKICENLGLDFDEVGFDLAAEDKKVDKKVDAAK